MAAAAKAMSPKIMLWRQGHVKGAGSAPALLDHGTHGSEPGVLSGFEKMIIYSVAQDSPLSFQFPPGSPAAGG
ncbi:hypothetical protein Vi05172_g1596 [Venturia inaequalis]|nr:hypothetical protein Vi05172_g1596 [Venturia inaequalis]